MSTYTACLRTLALASIVLFVAPSASADSGPVIDLQRPLPLTLATVDATGSFSFRCVGSFTTSFFKVGAEASVLEVGPVKVFTIDVEVVSSRTQWEYTCESNYSLHAVGTNGLSRTVRLSERGDDGLYHDLAYCSYSGVTPNTGCTATHIRPAETSRQAQGVAEAGDGIPHMVKACIGSWIRGTNQQSPVSTALLDAVADTVDLKCKQATIAWTNATPPTLLDVDEALDSLEGPALAAPYDG